MNLSLRYQAVIFDLDGTLIDSAPSILDSFEIVLKRAGIQPLVPFNDSLIGPPLRQTLVKLTGITGDADIDTLVEYFKESYDTVGFQATRVYDGVEELLAALAGKQVQMAIATNKRKIPACKIINMLGWEYYFTVVGSLDDRTPPHPDKAALIGAVLSEMGVDVAASVYVGDKPEDGEAANANQIPFIAAGWGYGAWVDEMLKPGWIHMSSSIEAMETLIVEREQHAYQV
ncbi:MAG: HAD hydrolase-like protein [Desulfuromonadales bacterium]